MNKKIITISVILLSVILLAYVGVQKYLQKEDIVQQDENVVIQYNKEEHSKNHDNSQHDEHHNDNRHKHSQRNENHKTNKSDNRDQQHHEESQKEVMKDELIQDFIKSIQDISIEDKKNNKQKFEKKANVAIDAFKKMRNGAKGRTITTEQRKKIGKYVDKLVGPILENPGFHYDLSENKKDKK